MLGEKREYLTIQILHNDMTVMVPCENADRAGLRRVIGEEAVKKVLAVLRDDVSQMPKNWNRRFKHNREKIKTGDVFELAEVVRNLAIRETEKGLSTGEKQMYTRAKKILASELMYALDMEEDEAEEPPRRPSSRTRTRAERRAGHGVAALEHSCPSSGSFPPAAAANALAPPGPRRSSSVPEGPAVEWSLAALAGACDRVVVAVPAGVRGSRRTAFAAAASRSESVRNALAAAPEADVAVVHDAARPLVTPELVRRCIDALEGCRRRDRRGAGDGHGQGGRSDGRGGAHAGP